MRRAAVAALLTLCPVAVSGQIADRVREVDAGIVRFAYETRPGVEICDRGIRMGERQMMWTSHGPPDLERACRFGPAEVELDIRDGVVRDVELVRTVGDRRADATDLGEVAPDVAAAFLLSLPRAGATSRGAEEAIFPAMLADVDEVWRALLEVAKDRSVVEAARKNALFWLGQEAAAAATAGLSEVAADEAEDQEIRDSAIFALSQRSENESIPALMEIARNGEHAESRRTAMFWLAQSKDERVIRFFEDILLRRIR